MRVPSITISLALASPALVSLALVAAITAAGVLSCGEALAGKENDGFRLSVNREVSEVMPETPVKVKLKKLADGSYTWEISGVDVQRIIEADAALRKYIKENGLKKK